MDSLMVVLFSIVFISIVSAIWRPFRAIALLMEAKARYWNAIAEIEEKKISR